MMDSKFDHATQQYVMKGTRATPSVFDWRRTPKDSIVRAISETAQRSASATKVVERHRAKDPDYGKISKLTRQTL